MSLKELYARWFGPHQHRYGSWYPVNPDRVAREPARPHLEQRECVVCGESDQLRIHESQVAAGKVKDILTEEADQP
jgi:hypothetical protein